MKINKYLIILLVLTLGFRLYMAFQSPYFDSDEAYFNARVIETVIDTKTPFLYDPFSYGGRELIFPQLFHYLMSLFLFIPNFMKIMPEIFITSLTLMAYLIAKKITDDETSSLITALLVTFSPILISTTSNQLSVYTLAIPVMYLMFYTLLDLKEKYNLTIFLVASFVLPLLHPISFLLILSLIFYVILSVSESIKIERLSKEAVLFSFFLILLINLIIFKKAFLLHGINVIWQNVPSQLLAEHFKTPTVLNSIYLIGIIPLILGSLGIFIGFFKTKNKQTMLLISPILAIILLMLLKMINFQTGLLFMSISLTLMASLSIKEIVKYIELTKLHKFKNYFIALSVIIIIILVVIPAFFSKTSIITSLEIENLQFLERNSPKDSTVLSPVSQGDLTAYFTKRKNVADTNFLLAPNPEQRLKDIKEAYTTVIESKALEIFHEYSIDYIFISRNAKEQYNITLPKYLEDGNCFRQKQATVYEIRC